MKEHDGRSLSLKSLHVWMRVVECGSLTKASAELGLAQSAISRQIRDLEAVLGASLFHRTGRGVLPTVFAQQLLPKTQDLCSQASELLVASRELSDTPVGTVALGMVPGVASRLTAEIYRLISERFPSISLRIHEGYSGDLDAVLASGRIDLAVINRYKATGSNDYRKLFDTQLGIVAREEVLKRLLVKPARKSSLPLPKSIDLAALVRVPLVMPPRPNAVRNLLDQNSHQRKIWPTVILESNSALAIRAMLRAHECATVLPCHALLDADDLHFIPLTGRGFTQHVVLATCSEHPFTVASRTVAKLIPLAVQKAFPRST